MDIERLKKLIKLANNNPNDNEANTAARKVCKIIEEMDFPFNSSNKFSGRTESYFTYDEAIKMVKTTTFYEVTKKLNLLFQ